VDIPRNAELEEDTLIRLSILLHVLLSLICEVVERGIVCLCKVIFALCPLPFSKRKQGIVIWHERMSRVAAVVLKLWKRFALCLWGRGRRSSHVSPLSAILNTWSLA
jgi:hypothetical protein